MIFDEFCRGNLFGGVRASPGFCRNTLDVSTTCTVTTWLPRVNNTDGSTLFSIIFFQWVLLIYDEVVDLIHNSEDNPHVHSRIQRYCNMVVCNVYNMSSPAVLL